MSLVFSDTSTYKGIVQRYEKLIEATRGYISGDTDRLKEFTADCNALGWDEFIRLALEASGTFQWDDSNHTDLPFATTNIVSGQRDYTFTSDENGNAILEIAKVAILPSATATQYDEIAPVDVQSEPGAATRFSDSTNTGTPYDYDKTGNSIIFGTVPNYNATNGLKIYFNREASYFAYNDQTKKPGVPGIFHEWFALRPAEDYAERANLANYPILHARRLKMEQDIKTFFGRREKDIERRITTKGIRFK